MYKCVNSLNANAGDPEKKNKLMCEENAIFKLVISICKKQTHGKISKSKIPIQLIYTLCIDIYHF